MKARILQLRPLTYEGQLQAFGDHIKGTDKFPACEECTADLLCPVGMEICMLAWALMCPQPRPSARQTAARRRSGS